MKSGPALSITVFEEPMPFVTDPTIAELVNNERAGAAGFSYTKVDQQAAIGYTLWQVLEAAVNGVKRLDERAMAR